MLDQHLDDPKLIEDMTDLRDFLKQCSDHKNVLIELFGCYRHFGHPTVEELGGVEYLKSNSREDISIDSDIMKKIVRAHNRMFIIAFISKQRRWPKCHISPFRKSQ